MIMGGRGNQKISDMDLLGGLQVVERCRKCLVIVITSGSVIDCTKRQDVFLLRQSCLRFLAISLICDAASCSLLVTMVCLARYLVH